MTDLTKLKRDEIGKWEWAAIIRKLERLEALELENAALDEGGSEMAKRLEHCEARERLLQAQNDAFDVMGADLAARLEKCKALCQYAQHHPKCAFLSSTTTTICTCGYDAARAAVEE